MVYLRSKNLLSMQLSHTIRKRKGLFLRLSAIGLLSLSSIPSSAQITLVSKGKAATRIVLTDSTSQTGRAAELLCHFVEQLSGATLPVQPYSAATATSTKSPKNVIFIGGTTDKVGEDGFQISCHNNVLRILSGGDKGAILGVSHLLERYLGINYLAKDAWTIQHTPSYKWQKVSTLTLPAIEWSDQPAFRYRQTNGYSLKDPLFRDWFGWEEPRDMFIANMWVHTFNQILPAARYGKEHPEWYSMINGKRQPGAHSQWCLTNEALFKQVCHNLDSIFQAHPELKMISVSQNDGNNTNCHCDACQAVEQEEGSPSGPIIRFLNRLAERYPDKEFSTLAYLFSMQPPRLVRPLPNVNIMLCSIDSKREVPLTDNESGRDFVKALEGWAQISDNLYIWDYAINFDNVVSPFPNFHVLQPNIALFKRNHANMLFEQENGSVGTDFAELRAYMIGKLMWNPEQDADSLMNAFLTDYYGDASPYIYSYRKLMEGALLASHKPLWIYDSPITHKDGMLNDQLMSTYNTLFDKAEHAVSNDTILLRRVRIARLPLQYAALEIARTRQGGDVDKALRDVKLFKDRCNEYNVPTLNERKNRPQDYCDLYLKRYLPSNEPNLLLGAKVSYVLPPAERYQPIAETALTDGLHGGAGYVEGWVGWEGKDADLILDMGQEKEIRHLESDFLHQLGAWVLLPKAVEYSVSTDGKTFVPFGKRFEFAEDRDVSIKFVAATADESSPVKARYVRVKITALGMCPDWHYGVGYPAWYFLDEVTAQ